MGNGHSAPVKRAATLSSPPTTSACPWACDCSVTSRRNSAPGTAIHSADIVTELIADPDSEWAHLSGKPLDQRRLAKELKRYGVESVDIRIGDVVRKGYMVDGDTGLRQAWRRWLSPAGKRDNGEPPGQGAAECSAQNHEVDNRNTNATAELPSDRELFEDVAVVADVAHTEEAADLGPRQHANGEYRPPAETPRPPRSGSPDCVTSSSATSTHSEQQTDGERASLVSRRATTASGRANVRNADRRSDQRPASVAVHCQCQKRCRT